MCEKFVSMDAITLRRDLVAEMKKETLLNLRILIKIKLLNVQHDIPRHILEQNALEKPTQSVFNQLSYYLVCIIDPKVAAALPWPIYDSITERRFRNDLGNFINQYSSKGLLTLVKTSYLVNPGFYKVTWLIYQMSQLAVQRVIEFKMKNDSQKKRYNDNTAKYKTGDKNISIQELDKDTEATLEKFSNYAYKREAIEKIAEKVRLKIREMESKRIAAVAQNFLDSLVDKFFSKHNLNDEQKADISKVKNVLVHAPFFDRWLLHVDHKLDEMDSKWDEKIVPFSKLCQETKMHMETLVARHTGEADKDSYMVQYNHETDEINTTVLQKHVNSEQKYILKNIVKEDKLSFPNLIRAFVIAIGHIINGDRVGNEIYQFNTYLEEGHLKFHEIVTGLQDVSKRIMIAEAKLQSNPVSYNHAALHGNYRNTPSLPDLSSIRVCSTRDLHQPLFDNFTPLGMSKHQFNLQRRTTLHTFVKPPPLVPLTMSFQAPKDNFLKSIASQSNRIGSHDHLNSTQNFHNISMICNETVAGVSTACTKEQLLRLLSTKKSSCSKKHKSNTNRSNIKIKKGGLFNESNTFCDSNGLYRSQSSPNLYENREIRTVQRTAHRKLSVMMESDSPFSQLSGITALSKDSSCEKSPAVISSTSLKPNNPIVVITPVQNKNVLEDLQDCNKNLSNDFECENLTKITSTDAKNMTPQNNTNLVPRISSLERIIHKYRKYQARTRSKEEPSDIQTIVEGRENMFAGNKILLPDLLSPSCSGSNNVLFHLDEFDIDTKECRRPRESLGAVLNVDDTFLDQFDLTD